MMGGGAGLRLSLLRHAHAGDPDRWEGPDETRPLSEKGREQARRLGKLLAAAHVAPDMLITSPKLRALQTSEIVAAALGADVRIDDRLAGSLTFSVVESVIEDAGFPHEPILVGHDPDFSTLASSLTGADITMRKGAIVMLEVPRRLGPNSAVIRWLLPPELLPTA
jgi:phosphohistidine phosphatase SixA